MEFDTKCATAESMRNYTKTSASSRGRIASFDSRGNISVCYDRDETVLGAMDL